MNTTVIDDFDGVTNEEFIEYFRIDLYSRMELINYTYPHESFDEEGGITEHVNRCSGLLSTYMNICYKNAESRRWEQEILEMATEDSKENNISDSDEDVIQETVEERAERYKIAEKKRNQAVSDRKAEFTAELGKLIEEYIEKVKVTDIDL